MFEKLLKILKITDEITSAIRSDSDKNKLLEKVDESVKEKLWPNLGGASDFVYGVLAYFHNIIKTRNILKNIPRFWYAGRDSNPRPTGS